MGGNSSCREKKKNALQCNTERSGLPATNACGYGSLKSIEFIITAISSNYTLRNIKYLTGWIIPSKNDHRCKFQKVTSVFKRKVFDELNANPTFKLKLLRYVGLLLQENYILHRRTLASCPVQFLNIWRLHENEEEHWYETIWSAKGQTTQVQYISLRFITIKS